MNERCRHNVAMTEDFWRWGSGCFLKSPLLGTRGLELPGKRGGLSSWGSQRGNRNRPTGRSGTPSPTSTFCLCAGYFQVLALKWKALWETDAQSYFGLDWLERSGLKPMPSCNAEELQSRRRKACYPSSRFDA